MWAIRRTSIHLMNRGLYSGTTQICCGKSDIVSCYPVNYHPGIIEPQGKALDALAVDSRRFHNKCSSLKSFAEIRNCFSWVGAKSSEEQDDASELEAASGDEMDDSELSKGENILDDIQNGLESLDTMTDVGKKKSPRPEGVSAMTKAILASALPVSEVLGKWVAAGNKVTQKEISTTMIHLRKREMFIKALELSKWLESTGHFQFTEHNFSSRVDLIAKVRGIFKAEEYIQQIPESFRGELVYRSLLVNCVISRNTRKSEEVFDKMKKLFPLGPFAYDQMLLLYKRANRRKITEVLSLMESENIKPTIFTYQILIDVRGQYNDISGMEQIIEKMKSQGVEPSVNVQISLARYYAADGLKDKAESILKKIEKGDLEETRWAYRYLLPIYASLGRDDEVERIWKVCEPKPRPLELTAAIEAWGQLKRIEDAEAVFNKMLKITKRPSMKHYALLLNIYTNNNMLAKAKDLIVEMKASGATDLPSIWDALVRLHVRGGELETAESVLEKGLRQGSARPMVTSFLTILDEYAKGGDVHNAEKIFRKMRQVGYPAHIRSYRSLLNAYVNAKAPAYGFNERVKGDNVIPDKEFARLLARADEFRKSVAGKLLG